MNSNLQLKIQYFPFDAKSVIRFANEKYQVKATLVFTFMLCKV